MATIRDIAAATGVSIASISRILNQDPTYKATAETRTKVIEAAKAMNYQPAANYRKRKKALEKSIGCIHRLTAEKQIDSYYASILRGIQKYLERNGYSLDFIQSQFDIADRQNLEAIFRTPCKGLIIMDTPSQETMDYIRSHVKHVVGIDTQNSDIDNVRYNRFEAGCRAMQYLIDNGHKKIAYIGSKLPKRDSLNFGRFEAYMRMMDIHGYPTYPEWQIDCEWERKICFDKTLELLKAPHRPTAIFVGSDHMAMACIAALHQMNISIPQDISVIGISDIEASKYLNPPLTTVAILQLEIGEIAAEDLLSRINGTTTVPKQIFVPTRLVIRESVRNINAEH